MARVRLLASCLAWHFACGSPTAPGGEIAPEATAYLNEALDIMEAHSIRKREVDWTELREKVFQAAGGAKRPEDTYNAIRYGLRLIGDGHSLFEPPGGLVGGVSGIIAGPVQGDKLGERIAYVTLPGIRGSYEHPDAVAFADRLQSLIRDLDSTELCGWIVDLRENTGGTMWPMLAGIGPVLGEGVVGAFISPEGERANWFYRAGAAGIDGQPIIRVGAPPYEILAPDPAVAVLTSRATGSSGEGVAIAFKARARTRSFGSDTAGFSTSNANFRLSDGAIISLTVSTMADRAGWLYGGVVEVDEEIENVELAQPAGATVDAARRWLLDQCL